MTDDVASRVVNNLFPLEENTWLARIDLLGFDGVPRPVPEVAGLAYAGKRNLWSGESESGKTWGAVATACEEIAAGRDVLWIDTDGMGEHAILERLRAFGATDDDIRDHFHYRVPTDRLTPEVVEALVSSLDGRLVVVDSFNATMALLGLDMKQGDDVEQFWQAFEPMCRAGFALVVIDHVTKSSEGRGPYAIGSERKHSGAYAHLRFDVIKNERVVREGTGRSALRTNKDRGAWFERPTAGVFEVTMSGGAGTWRVVQSQSADEWKPTGLMEIVSSKLQLMCAVDGDPSKNQLEQAVTGKAKYKREAIEHLVAGGYARAYKDGAATRLEHVKPYLEAEDPDLVPTSSPARDELLDPTSSPRPPLIGDEDEKGSNLVPVPGDEVPPNTSRPNAPNDRPLREVGPPSAADREDGWE